MIQVKFKEPSGFAKRICIKPEGDEFQMGEFEVATFYFGDYVEFDVENIVDVQADGQELDYIRMAFEGLPDCTNAKLVRWFGDDAKFIAFQLSHRKRWL